MARPHPTDQSSTVALSSPRHAGLWAALVYAGATLLLAYPALGGAFLVNPMSDQYIAGYGFRDFAAQSLRAGAGFPQWNPYLFGGMPYIAAMHGDIFYPTFLLRMVLRTDVAMTWGFIIHVFLAGCFTYLFLRTLGVGFIGALVGGLAYMLSGPISAYVSPGHDGKLFVSSLLPLTLWLLLRLVRDGRHWAPGALAIVIGLAVLSPHPQLLQYLLLTGGAFTLFLAFGRTETGVALDRAVAVRRLGLALAAVIVGGLIGAVQYLPVREYVDWSPRAGGKGWEHAVSYSMPLEELLNTVVPQFSGILDDYWGRNGIHLHSEYPGVVVLILAGAGMFAASVRRATRWFWIGVLAVSLAWALGGSTPFYRLVYLIVPGTKYFRAPSTMMFVTMFSLAVFASFGADRIARAADTVPKRFLLLWAIAVPLVGLITLGVAPVVADSIASQMAAAGYSPQQTVRVSDGARENQAALLVGVLRSLAFAFGALAVLRLLARSRIPSRTAVALLGGLLVADLWSIERLYWRFSEPGRVLFASDPAIEAARTGEPGRIVTVDLVRSASGKDPVFYGSAPMVHRVRTVTGYHGNQLGRYERLLEQGSRYFLGDRPEFWRHENVRYLYTTAPDSVMPGIAQQLGYQGQFTKLVGPVRNADGAIVYLYRVPGDNPPAWIAPAFVRATDDQALATVLDPRFDPARAAIVDTVAQVTVADAANLPAPMRIKASVTRFDPGVIDIRLDSASRSRAALVVSENFYPGWKATVRGSEVPVVRANFNLIGVDLPPGARDVQLRFVDARYATGRKVTLVAMLAALIALAAGAFLDQRRARNATA